MFFVCPQLNKLSSTSNSQVASNREEQKVSPAVVGSQHVAATSATVSTTTVQVTSSSTSLPVSTAFSVDGTTSLPGLGSQPAIEAVKRAQELAAKMGYRQDPEFAPLINMFPGSSAVSEMAAPQRPSKAPVLRLDAQESRGLGDVYKRQSNRSTGALEGLWGAAISDTAEDPGNMFIRGANSGSWRYPIFAASSCARFTASIAG